LSLPAARRHRLALLALPLALVALPGCQVSAPAEASKTAATKPAGQAAPSVGGEAAAGKELFLAKGCVACHRAPDIREAVGVVGPDLKGIASRPKIAAVLDNTPENLRRWIIDPPGNKPGTAMPTLGITEAEATNLVAYLETLK
jgi:cytochrome c2